MRVIAFYLLFLAVTSSSFAQQGQLSKRIYTTTRLIGEAPHIDGRFDDSCWQGEGWMGNFTQQIPRQGDAPSQPTEFKVLYDEDYLYVAIRAIDSEPDKIERRVARRDVLAGDMTGIAFDSYFDHRTAYEFNLTAAGAKVDIMHKPPKQWDTTWDAVWDGAVGREDSAWTAEMRIPFSQLRFPEREEQVWGLHVWRWIHRFEEESQFNLIPFDAAFFVPNFGELHGIKNLRPKRRIELLPYTTARMNTFEPVEGDPFADGHRGFTEVGLDAKVGLSSAFTMDLTLNPDFGQVEADPSVMNLTAFETFYEEKRPFFLEGSNLFSYEFEGEEIFYSRRIGSSPKYQVSPGEGEYARAPESTTILGAAKITGKTENGLSVGILESLTSEEFATVQTSTGRHRTAVEPLTNFFVGRVEKEYGEGRTVLGGMLTATNRRLNHDHLDFLVGQAYTGGLSFAHYWLDRTYFVRLNVVGSSLHGSEEAIARIQRSSVHYYQRPDADYLDSQTPRTRLSGTGGSIEIGRAGNGRWSFSEELSWQSPGLDFNEAGFMRTPADRINLESVVRYQVNQPSHFFRSYSISFDHSSEWNYGGDMNGLSGRLVVGGQFKNFWRFHGVLVRSRNYLDMRWLRGGPSLRMPGTWESFVDIHTDGRRAISFGLSGSRAWRVGLNSRGYDVSPSVSWRVNQAFSLSGSVDYANHRDELQYVTTAQMNGSDRYLLGRISQETVSMTIRASYSLRPDLVIQFYGQPFVSAGRYDDLKVITDPRAERYERRVMRLIPIEEIVSGENTYYAIDETGDGQADYQIEKPDFTFREFRSNLVLRWEYKPGSNLYLVWSQRRSGSNPDGLFHLREDFSRLYDLHPDNVFAVKLSYWFDAG